MKRPILVASLGGGFSSTARMPRVILEKYPEYIHHWVTAVLPNEHPSMWNLYDSVEKTLNIHVTYIAYDKEKRWKFISKEDRTDTSKLYTPFDIFDMTKFIGNSRNDPCSRFLKRETLKYYLQDMFSPDRIALAVGIHSTEVERSINIRQNWEQRGYKILFPLIDLPKYTREEEAALLKEWYDVELDLYKYGFEHNNCGGACVKAGQRQWALLWLYYPEVYQDWENRERQWRLENGDHTILKMAVGGKRRYITLEQFRIDLENALVEGKETFLTKYLKTLSSSAPCAWCSAI